MKNKRKKIRFPFGMFLFIFLILVLITSLVIGANFYVSTKDKIREIERINKDYATSLAEACSQIAELGPDAKVAADLYAFFKKIRENGLVFKAFYVRANGKIIAHSNIAEARRLKYNIAADEFTYNLEQIFLPLKEKGDRTLLIDYHIVDQKIPFRKEILKLLTLYFYKGIDRNGWLATKAIIKNEQKTGTVNFIFSKHKLYAIIMDNIRLSVIAALALYIVSFLVAFISALVLFARYKSIQKNVPISDVPNQFSSAKPDKATGQRVQATSLAGAHAASPNQDIQTTPTLRTGMAYEEKNFIKEHPGQVIQDAIPITKDNKRK